MQLVDITENTVTLTLTPRDCMALGEIFAEAERASLLDSRPDLETLAGSLGALFEAAGMASAFYHWVVMPPAGEAFSLALLRHHYGTGADRGDPDEPEAAA